MITSVFLSFAPELIHAIGEELDTNSMKDLRLTCKHLGKVLGPLIRRSVTINLNQSTIERDMPKLRAFASRSSTTSQDTREITIQALSPTFDPSYRGERWQWKDGASVRMDVVPEVPVEALQAEEELKTSLLDALVSLKGVYKLRWSPIIKDNEWVQTIVVDALKRLPNLRVLEVDLEYCAVPLNLEEITGLRSLSMIKDRDSYKQILESLSRMMAKNPEFTSINLSPYRRWGDATPPSHSLHQLFKYYPEKAPPLRLLHIGLSGCFVRLDDTTIPHLRFLKSLRLNTVIDPYAAPNSRYPINKDSSEERKLVGSSPDDIWKALESIGTQLEIIEHDSVTPSFLDYLSSLSGLRKIDLAPDSWMWGPDYSNPLALQFFAKSLSCHVQTLEELHITPSFEGRWSFGSHTLSVSAISSCVNLKILGVSVISADLRDEVVRPKGKGKGKSKVNTIKRLIDMSITHLPRLGTLFISSANLESLRGAMCGNSSISHFMWTHKAMVNSVKNYRAPASCKRLPKIVIMARSFCSNETFIEKREDMLLDARLIYA